jgi:hypothetical protein
VRWIKTLTIWIIISLIIQLGILFYLDNYFLSEDSNIAIKKISKKTICQNDNYLYNEDKKHNVKILIPDEAGMISLSYDGKYISYYLENRLVVVNTYNGKINSVKFDKERELSYYKWLPDRNRMLIVEKTLSSQVCSMTLSYFDVIKGEKNKIKDFILQDVNSEVESIALSTLTNIIYIKINHIGDRSSILRMDITNNLIKIKTDHYFIGKIRLIPHEDKLVYEDSINNTIHISTYVTGESKQLIFNGADRVALLGIDDEDNIYVGKLEQGRIKEIFYGDYRTPEQNWRNINLTHHVKKEKIYISQEGNVYLRDGLSGLITEVRSHKVNKYTGYFIQFYEKGMAFMQNGELITKEISIK